jgi:hypothetical protein
MPKIAKVPGVNYNHNEILTLVTPNSKLQTSLKDHKNNHYYIVYTQINSNLLPLQCSRLFHRSTSWRKGKSGQQGAPYFLTGRYPRGYSSVTENNHPPAGG